MKKLKFFTPAILFALIFFVAAFLRLYRLNSIPPGANRDEASIGYTAYSLLKTGRDEYGRTFPLSFESFGDWKLPLYIYTDIPFVALLGPTELAIRLPSALAGIAAVAVLFFLVIELTGNRAFALLSMMVLAISPWHLHLSRVESESNVAVLLVSLGVLTFLMALRKHKDVLLIPSALFFGLTYFTYAGNHVTTTLLVPGMVFIYRKSIPKTGTALFAAVLFLMLAAIIFAATLTGADRTKISGISIFGDPTVIHEKIELPRVEHSNLNSISAWFFHNRVAYTVEKITQNYLNTFSPQFLFISGGTNHAHNIGGFGNMYIIESLFLLLGVAALIVACRKKEFAFLLWWLFISPVAASITKDAPHTNRSFAIFPALAIIVALGILWLAQNIASKGVKKIVISFIVLFYLFNIAVYFDRYYTHFPRNESASWGAGYKALHEVVSAGLYKDKRIVMAHPETSPYIYFLLYSAYDPNTYFTQAVRYPPTEDAFVHVRHFGRFDFRDIDWSRDTQLQNTLLIAPPDEIPQTAKDKAHTKIDITLPSSVTQFTILENN